MTWKQHNYGKRDRASLPYPFKVVMQLYRLSHTWSTLTALINHKPYSTVQQNIEFMLE